ncbi:hypothetical protein NBRC116602_28730 [Hyphomicrobiales bacterium 4NK60-0047b]|jgi:hypothetical protein
MRLNFLKLNTIIACSALFLSTNFFSTELLAIPNTGEVSYEASPNKYQNLRTLVASKKRAVPISEVEGLREYVRKVYPHLDNYHAEISAILIDLDKKKDGVKEILLRVEAGCGSGGCYFEVLKRTGDDRLIPLLNSTQCYDLKVGKGYSNGYRNLKLNCRTVVDFEKQKWTVKNFKLRFNGQHYE